MRKDQQIYEILQGLGIPGRYGAFEQDYETGRLDLPQIPYYVYSEAEPNNFAADGIVYFSAERFNIVIYTAQKLDPVFDALETAFQNNNIYWSRDISFLDANRCYQTIYRIEV